MLARWARERLADILTFSPPEQALLNRAFDAAETLGRHLKDIGGIPRIITQTGDCNKRGGKRRVYIAPTLILTHDLLIARTQDIADSMPRYDIAVTQGIVQDYRKTHAVQLESAIIDDNDNNLTPWYASFIPKRLLSDCIIAKETLLGGAYITLAEADSIMRATRLLGKETDDAMRIYNGLDTLVSTALLYPQSCPQIYPQSDIQNAPNGVPRGER